MTQSFLPRLALVAALTLGASAAFANNYGVTMATLTFPSDTAETTRACALPLAPAISPAPVATCQK